MVRNTLLAVRGRGDEMINHYECYLDCNKKFLMDNVFTKSVDKQVIK